MSITIRKESSRERQRFSAGHELGHWMRDRGKLAFHCAGTDFTREWQTENPEKRANRYATDLLLPDFMFTPRAKNRPITFASVEALAKDFSTSLTATAIRLVELGSFPAMIVCSSLQGRCWFIRGEDVPAFLYPVEKPDRDSLAYALLAGGSRSGPIAVYADTWINHRDAHRYKLVEDSRKVSGEVVITLLWWENEQQLLDLTR